MKKALAQNPNLLRTLIGLSLTLIFMLSYAVYGATVSPSVYLYSTEARATVYTANQTDELIERTYSEDSNTTTWAWQVVANGSNLTWVNITASSLSPGAQVRISNGAGLYSHPLLGVAYEASNPRDDEFSCALQCVYDTVHERMSDDGGDIAFHALTSVDPARRSNGSVFAQSLDEAEEKSRAAVAYFHSPSLIRVEVIEQGNRSTQPFIETETINEAFEDVAVFSVDASTEFLWALAAVVGCFSMVLIPSFTVYFASRAKERRDEGRLQLAQNAVNLSLSTSDATSNDTRQSQSESE